MLRSIDGMAPIAEVAAAIEKALPAEPSAAEAEVRPQRRARRRRAKAAEAVKRPAG